MKDTLSSLLLVALLLAQLISVQLSHATEVTLSSVAEQQKLTPYVSYYVDTNKLLEIADITAGNDLPWTKTHNQQLNFGFSDAAIWLSINVQNPTPFNAKRLIELPYSLIDNVEFYHINNQGRLLANYIMGSAQHFSSRPIAHHNFIIPLTLPADASSTIFLRVTGNHSLHVPMTLWSIEAFWKVSQFENQLNFVYFTLLLALMAYPLYRLSPRPRIRRYVFSGMIVTPLLALLTIEGYGFQYLWPDNPEWNQTGLATLIPGSLAFLCLYLHIIFYQTTPNIKTLDMLVSLAIINILLLFAPIIFEYSVVLILGLVSAITYSITLLYMSVRYWHKIARPKKITLLGFNWLVLSCLIFVLAITDTIPAFPVIETPLQIGFFLYAFSLFWAQLATTTRASLLAKKKIQQRLQRVSESPIHSATPPCH
ncbi:hypothetical protein A9Q99_10665 [Gammaproteobacteria bacterium 45_16_T64]|nr:hypothetical protein A9Q99_10665 [Gammaproteobacteria bacterium 45_16_T64]